MTVGSSGSFYMGLNLQYIENAAIVKIKGGGLYLYHNTTDMNYQKLFEYMSREHGVTLLESDMQEICNIVNEMQNQALRQPPVISLVCDKCERHIDTDALGRYCTNCEKYVD
jgi:hypothetical protein